MPLVNPAIVVVGYNRHKPLKRLLDSIAAADFPKEPIPLVISLDYHPEQSEVFRVAEKFSWQHGPKQIIKHEKNLGLRQHILKCMRLAEEFESVIILEDDLFVSPNFYNYSMQSLHFAASNSEIAGVSLYNHETNVHTSEPFFALDDGGDNWFIQLAASWGQAWTWKQLEGFLSWYGDNPPNIDQRAEIPAYIRSWSERSWLKYFDAYLIETDKYFLYPRKSLTTNFHNAGTHSARDNSGYQVHLYQGVTKDYSFVSMSQSKAIYDAFFENKLLSKALGLKQDNVLINLYGYRIDQSKRFELTPAIKNYKIQKSFALQMRPRELNVFYNLEGKDLFLYDTQAKVKNPVRSNRLGYIRYRYRFITFKQALRASMLLLKARFMNK